MVNLYYPSSVASVPFAGLLPNFSAAFIDIPHVFVDYVMGIELQFRKSKIHERLSVTLLLLSVKYTKAYQSQVGDKAIKISFCIILKTNSVCESIQTNILIFSTTN